jgi:hypothetical protein
VFDKESLWMHINEMGNNRFKYLLDNSNREMFIIVTVILDRKIIFSLTSKYLATPMEISQAGGVFRSSNTYNSEDDKAIKKGQ